MTSTESTECAESTEFTDRTPCRCSVCGMLFQRDDHLKRHLDLHKGYKPFACSVCNRHFSRRDTLERHASIHGIFPPHYHQSNTTGETQERRGAKACASCRISKQRCDGADPCSRCLQKHKPCQYLPRRARQRSRWRIQEYQTPPAATGNDRDLEGTPMASMPQDLEPLPGEQHTSHNEHGGNMSEENAIGMSHISNFAFEPQPLAAIGDTARIPSDMLNTSWEGISTWPDLQANNTSPSLPSFEPPDNPPAVSSATQGMTGSTRAGVRISHPHDWFSLLGPSQPFDHTSTDPSSTESPGGFDAGFEDFGHVEALLADGYENLGTWIRTIHTTWDNGVAESSMFPKLPSRRTLNAFIQLYFEEFHHTLPIIHRPTFDPNSASCLLVLAIGNIGRRFSKTAQDSSVELGLQNLAHDAVKSHLDAVHTSEAIPVWLAQAVLLCHIAETFTSDRTLLERTLLTKSVLHVVLRKLEPPLEAASSSLQERREGADDQALWEAWVQCEVLRRTAYGLWLLDSQYCLLFDLTPAVPTEALQIPLPCHEGLWEKATAVSWRQQWSKTNEVPTLRAGLESLYMLSPLPGDIGAFSFLLVLFGFFRDLLFIKQAEDTGLSAVVNMHGEQITSASVHRQDLWDLLDPTRRPDVDRANPVTVQYYHMIGVVLRVPLKDLLASSGWRVTRSKRQETRRKLTAWVSAHGDNARRAALHAGALFRQFLRCSTSGYQEPGAVLIATLALWMYNSSLPTTALVGPTAYKEQQTPPIVRLGHEMDQDESLGWILEGNHARPFVTGVGNIHAPGGYSKAVHQAITVLASLTKWRISELFSNTLQELLNSFEKDMLE